MNITEIIQKIGLTGAIASARTLSVSVGKESFATTIRSLVEDHGLFLSSLYGADDRHENGSFAVHAVLSSDHSDEWLLLDTLVSADDPKYPSVTAILMAAHWYERYLHDMFGIVPEGHPDLRRLVNHENIPAGTFPLRKDFAWDTKLAHADEPYPMGHVEGEGIYEIPVGPIHAGIIEPGHFRFNVAGERIITLEGKLFFTHKGVEKLLEGKTVSDGLKLIERVSDDMSASHALAYCQAVESICQVIVPARALALRTIITELERLTMHIHDLANIGGMGTGYSFIAVNGFRIKERLVRLSDKLLKNRFWRGLIVPGGVSRDFDSSELEEIMLTAEVAYKEMKGILATALQSDGFLDRLQTSGILPLEAAKAFGGVGLPARASGLDRDVRRDHPYAFYSDIPFDVVVRKNGDVYDRYLARISELDIIIDLMKKTVDSLPKTAIMAGCEIRNGIGIGAVESWRGEILCVVKIRNGVIDRCFPRDPSFCNWALFSIIGPGNIVPDFPLCNKSLNLSYSGTDL